jgi:hypothetical protein
MADGLHTYAPEEAPREVLDLAALLVPQLLAGDNPQLTLLRSQFEQGRVSSVESSGVGFFVNYDVPTELAIVTPPNFAGGDARIKVAGLEVEAGCVLFIREGRLAFLEAYTYGERWPEGSEVISVAGVFPLIVPEP